MSGVRLDDARSEGSGACGGGEVAVCRAGWLPAPAPSDRARRLDAELDRRARWPELVDAPADAAERLAGCSPLVVGAGSVGLAVGEALVRLGVGGLSMCDPDRIGPESLLTHPVRPADVGRSKARLLATRAAEIAPRCAVRFFEGAFEALALDALADVTHVVLATDALSAELAVGQAALRFGLPLVQAAVHGPTLCAQVRVLPGDPRGGGPCLGCGFGAADWAALDRGTRFRCAGDPAAVAGGRSVPLASTTPTRSLPQLCALAGQLAVGELFADLMALRPAPAPGEGSVLELCAYHGGTTRTRLTRRPDCPVDHTPWRLRTLDADVGRLTPRGLAAAAGESDLRRVSLRVDGHVFATRAICGCPRHPRLGRFQAAGAASSGTCHDCGQARGPHPIHSHEVVPGEVLVEAADRRLADLGVAPGTSVLVRGRAGATLLRSPASAPVPPRRVASSAVVARAARKEIP